MFFRITSAAGFAAIAGMLGVWVSDRAVPIDVQGVELLTPEVRPGGDLRIRFDVLRHRECITKTQKVLKDAEGKIDIVEAMEIARGLRPLGPDTYVSVSLIPKNFANGTAEYRSARSFICNPVHHFWPVDILIAVLKFEIAGEPLAEPIEVIPRRN